MDVITVFVYLLNYRVARLLSVISFSDDERRAALCPVVVPETTILQDRYLHLDELLAEDIIWVDEVDGLLDATCQIEGVKVVGVDCEWKPNYVKGSQPNKVN